MVTELVKSKLTNFLAAAEFPAAVALISRALPVVRLVALMVLAVPVVVELAVRVMALVVVPEKVLVQVLVP